MGKLRTQTERAPIGNQVETNKMTDSQKIRAAEGKQMRLGGYSIQRYLDDPDNDGYQLFWEDTDSVEKWTDLGAEPVRRKAASSKIYKGVNDRNISEYVIEPNVSVIDGRPIDNYLLKLPVELYQKYKKDPKDRRNEEVRRSMGIAKVEGDAKVLPNVTGLKTYAPKVDGKQATLTTQTGPMLDAETFDA